MIQYGHHQSSLKLRQRRSKGPRCAALVRDRVKRRTGYRRKQPGRNRAKRPPQQVLRQATASLGALLDKMDVTWLIVHLPSGSAGARPSTSMHGNKWRYCIWRTQGVGYELATWWPNGTSAQRVLALVSGMPAKQRLCRELLVLQAYIDESYTNGAVFVMAGYVATVEQWMAFSDEWASLLGLGPPHFRELSELHMAEMTSPLGIEQSEMFYRVIERHLRVSVSCSTSRYQTFMPPSPVSSGRTG